MSILIAQVRLLKDVACRTGEKILHSFFSVWHCAAFDEIDTLLCFNSFLTTNEMVQLLILAVASTPLTSHRASSTSCAAMAFNRSRCRLLQRKSGHRAALRLCEHGPRGICMSSLALL